MKLNLLIVQGYQGNRLSLADPERVRKFLTDSTWQLDMHPTEPPIVHNFDYAQRAEDRGIDGTILVAEPDMLPESGGASGIIPLEESHFALHTWPENAFANALFLSCGNLDLKTALSLTRKRFGFKVIEYLPLQMGLRGIFNELGLRLGKTVPKGGR